MPRSSPVLLAALVVMAACSSGGDDASTAPPPTQPPATTTAVAKAGPAAGEPAAGAAEAGPQATGELVLSVALEIDVEGFPTSAAFEIALDPVAGVGSEPFGSFASCSGWRDVIGTYSVVASDPEGPVRAIGILSAERIDGPGIVDADVTLEVADGTRDATGTMTLEPDLRSGSFAAFVATGGSVEGTFECTGSAVMPAPLVEGPDDGVLDTVEVVALLRQDEAERVVGLTVDTAVAAVDAACPGTAADAGPVVVRVEGDQRVGGMTAFELTATTPPAVRLQVGSDAFEFGDLEVELEPGGTAGRFSGVGSDGTSVDGAFRCT